LVGALAVLCCAAAAAIGQTPAPTADAELERGRTLYRVHCRSCHGEAGRGDGPVAGELKTRPTDLTALWRESGRFPETEVTAAIDGRADVRAHGAREMPVWGMTFFEPGRDTPQESEIQAAIRALVRYVRSLERR
jgi:mono/diheme cytochrome c family protein